jgi:WD40 repeat protein
MFRLLLSLLIVQLALSPAQAQNDIVLYSLSYSPDGDYVAGVGNRVVVWDGATGDVVANIPITLDSSIDSLVDADWSPDGHRLVVAGTDRRIRILDFSNDAQPLGALLAEFEATILMDVRSVGWSPDGNIIVVGGAELSPRIEFWDASTYMFDYVTSYAIGAKSMAWHPDPERNLIATTNSDFNGVNLANTTEYAPRNDTVLCSNCAADAIAYPLAWNHTGTLLAIGYTSGDVFIVNADTSDVVAHMRTGTGVRGIAWTNNDQYVLSMSRTGLDIWDSVTGSLLNVPTTIQAGVFALNPVNNQIFVFYNGPDVGEIVELSTLLDPAPLMTATFTPT